MLMFLIGMMAGGTVGAAVICCCTAAHLADQSMQKDNR